MMLSSVRIVMLSSCYSAMVPIGLAIIAADAARAGLAYMRTRTVNCLRSALNRQTGTTLTARYDPAISLQPLHSWNRDTGNAGVDRGNLANETAGSASAEGVSGNPHVTTQHRGVGFFATGGQRADRSYDNSGHRVAAAGHHSPLAHQQAQGLGARG